MRKVSALLLAAERRAISGLAGLYASRMLGLFMVLPVLALYADTLEGATPLLVGLALGVYGLTQAVLQIPFGWLSDRIGRKRVIAMGLLIFAAGSVVAATADTIGGVIVGRALQGSGAIAAAIMALLADQTREQVRTVAMATIGLSIGVSFAVAMVLGPWLASWGGLSSLFWFTALLTLVGLLVLWRWVPPAPGACATGMSGWTVSNSSVSLPARTCGVWMCRFLLCTWCSWPFSWPCRSAY